jgi:hypothetical protein
VHGVYSNHETPGPSLRWTVSSGPRGIHVRTDRAEKTTDVTSETPIVEVLRPLAVAGPALHLLALLDRTPEVELGLVTLGKPDALPATATLGPIWHMETRPKAAAVTLSPAAFGSWIFLAATQTTANGVVLRLVQVSPDGRVRAETQRLFPGLVAEAAVAAWWSTRGRLHVTFLATSEKDRTQAHLVETILEKDLSTATPPKVPDPLPLGDTIAMARIEYFE